MLKLLASVDVNVSSILSMLQYSNSHKLKKGAVNTGGTDCHFVREGILSELVIFGDTLFANVAGPKEDARTLYDVLAATGEVGKTRGSWREVGF